LYLQGRQGRVLIVVKSRAVKLRFAALSGDANIANSRIFGAEIASSEGSLVVGEPKIVLVDRWPSIVKLAP